MYVFERIYILLLSSNIILSNVFHDSSFVLRRAIKQQISICLIYPSSADGWLKEAKLTTVMHKIGVALLKTQS